MQVLVFPSMYIKLWDIPMDNNNHTVVPVGLSMSGTVAGNGRRVFTAAPIISIAKFIPTRINTTMDKCQSFNTYNIHGCIG